MGHRTLQLCEFQCQFCSSTESAEATPTTTRINSCDLLDNCGDFTAGVGGGMNQQQQQQQTPPLHSDGMLSVTTFSSLENNNLEKKIYHVK